MIIYHKNVRSVLFTMASCLTRQYCHVQQYVNNQINTIYDIYFLFFNEILSFKINDSVMEIKRY